MQYKKETYNIGVSQHIMLLNIMDNKDHIALTTQCFDRYGNHFIRDLDNDGWLNHWKPNKYTPARSNTYPYSTLRQSEYLSKKEYPDFIAHITQQLLDLDPSDNKTYFPTLLRWFRFGLNPTSLSEAKKKLENYHALAMQGQELLSDPFQSNRLTGNAGIKDRPQPKYIIDAANTPNDLEDMIWLAQRRLEKSGNFQPPETISKDDLYHHGDDFILYYEDEYGDFSAPAFVIMLPNGAIYALRTGYTLLLENESDRTNRCMPELLFRNIPQLANAFKPIIQTMMEDKDYRSVMQLAGIFARANIPSPFDKGDIQEAFKQHYQKQSDPNDTHRDSSFYSLYENLEAVVYFQKHDVVDPDFIKALITNCIASGNIGTSRRCLTLINRVPIWREAITADDIAPIFNVLADPRNNADRITRQPHKYLAQSMAMVATIRQWRDGNEAIHLPAAIGYILEVKNWLLLKKILWCATRADDPIAKIWRDAIPTEVRQSIELHRFDNSYKMHNIHLLMHRMTHMDNSDTYVLNCRLKDVPLSRASHILRQGTARKISARRRPSERTLKAG